MAKQSLAERMAKSFMPEESFDPADIDTLGDDTVAGKKRFSAVDSQSTVLKTEKGRLRLRAQVPELQAYSGKAVSRQAVFGEEKSEDKSTSRIQQLSASPFEDDEGDVSDEDAQAAAGFSISSNMEQEYERMMKASKQELEIMRQPSAEDLAKREGEAKALKNQLEMWGSLVELRIHLEGALGIGHRLPAGATGRAFRTADKAIASEVDLAATDARKLTASLLSLQEEMSSQHDILHRALGGLDGANGGQRNEESSAWSVVDERLQPVLDWALGVADEWKERTRLDARRGFKVLDQALRLQMQAVAETEPAKLRKRCTPPAGKHKVFGVSAASPEAAADSKEPQAEEDEAAEEIFDDRDFYVQLLREVLSSSSSGALAAGGDDEKELRAELQGRRASKRKARAEVERRASKGRKIRYRPIEKLQNFMASRPRGAFASANAELGLEEVEPLNDTACEALLSSLFAIPKAAVV
eukprot:gb/GFBE01004803.1/.p1 GENE.gb/GFBE01004803.1/~~gb/GFBE01004803.1/.p1  ORF type:complete len:471 (+),score=136.89 gb/GFBE01004803.1/:1-1413(+)